MVEEATPAPQNDIMAPAAVPADMAQDAQKKLEELKEVVEQYREKIFTRFEDYILAMSILPPREEDQGKVAILILIDDIDSKKIPKNQLKDKLLKVFDEMAAQVDKNILPEVLLLSELWQYCYDGKYDVLQDIAMSAPVFDVGMLAAIKLAEIHKQMVLKKFEKYIVTYVLGGSLVQGTATTKSDVDVFVVIDDTDVKKMTRVELRDKLRAIIIDLGYQAGDITGTQNKINIQAYLLTDFWDNIKEANPVIFTFLRDGVPFFDRGIFMPWKQLLEMGKVKPSQEAIDLFMSSGEQMIKRVQLKLKEIGMEDFFWATVTPSQAAIMLYGFPPPTPKELPQVLRDLFVDKEKLLKSSDVDIIEKILKVRKDMEHGDKTDITGKEIDELFNKTQDYLKAMNKLFDDLQKVKDNEHVMHTFENTITLLRDVLRTEGHDPKEADLMEVFEKELVQAGNVPEKMMRLLQDIKEAKEKHGKKEFTKTDVADITRKGREFFRYMLDYLQRKRGQELERAKIRVKHGDLFGEVLLLDSTAFIIQDIQAEQKTYSKAPIQKDGSLGKVQEATEEEYEEAIAKAEIPDRVFIKEPIFEDLKSIFGKTVEILVTQ